MDLGFLGTITLDWGFFTRLVDIIIIDLILAGDNAVVIAMAVRSLPQDQRKKGIFFGAGAAVLLRVVLTFFVSQLLVISFLKLAGGALILWIAVKLFVEGAPEESTGHEAKTIMQAMRLIVIADITMSVDNMLAVGGAARGNLFLLLFGLALSIPFVIFTSNLLSSMMDRYPIIIYFGAAILGKVGGEMMITDPFVVGWLHPGTYVVYAVEAMFAAGVLVVGKIRIKWMLKKEEEEEQDKTESDVAGVAVKSDEHP